MMVYDRVEIQKWKDYYKKFDELDPEDEVLKEHKQRAKDIYRSKLIKLL